MDSADAKERLGKADFTVRVLLVPLLTGLGTVTHSDFFLLSSEAF